jgi:hypothetical protein
MAVTLRFRPVVGGPADRPTSVFYLVEEPSGQVLFGELEFSWPIKVSLEAATPEDLPWRYGSRGLEITILRLHEATGETLADAHERMTAALEALAAGTPMPAPKQRGSPRSAPAERSA